MQGGEDLAAVLQTAQGIDFQQACKQGFPRSGEGFEMGRIADGGESLVDDFTDIAGGQELAGE